MIIAMENSGLYTYAKRIAPLIRTSTRVLSTLKPCMRFVKNTVLPLTFFLVYSKVTASPLAERTCIPPPSELQSNQAETQNASWPGAVKITSPGRESFLTTYSATVGAGSHGKPVGGEF